MATLLAYLLAATVVSLGEVTIPVGPDMLPSGFFLVLLAVSELPLSEALLIGFSSTLLRALLHDRSGLGVARGLAVAARVCTGIGLAGWARHQVPSSALDPVFPAPLLAGALFWMLFCVVSSSLIPREGERHLDELRRLPGLLSWFVGAAYLAHLVAAASRGTGVAAPLLAIPVCAIAWRAWKQVSRIRRAESGSAAELEQSQERTLQVLSLVAELRQAAVHDHGHRVEALSIEVGRELGMDETDLKALRAAALLHDIGTLAVPDYVLLKAGKLSSEEFETVKRHVDVGTKILERLEFPYPVTPLVAAHHERWNGSGYPAGLVGRQIPAGARILAAVDYFDALVSDRPYRLAYSAGEALDMIRAESGKLFDPEVVELLVRSRLVTDPCLSALAPASDGCESPLLAVVAPIASARLESRLVTELGQHLGNSLNLDETLDTVARLLSRLVRFEAMVLYSLEEKRLEPVWVHGVDRTSSVHGFPIGDGISGWVAEHDTPVVNGDGQVEPAGVDGMRSVLAIPLHAGDRVKAVLSLYHSRQEAFSRENLGLLQSVSGKIAASVENAMRYREIESTATTDWLTGLPNGGAMMSRLTREISRAERENGALAVVVCDLDGFKAVNDRFGHLAGNDVLRLVAGGLRKICRDCDFLARLGGDEFVLILAGYDSDAFGTLAIRLDEVACEAGVTVCGEDLLSMSIGAAVYPRHGLDAATLLEMADHRMYASKRSFRQMRQEHLLSERASA